MEADHAAAGGLGFWGVVGGRLGLGDREEDVLSGLGFGGGGSGEFLPEISEVGFAVGEGFGDGELEEIVGGGFDGS